MRRIALTLLLVLLLVLTYFSARTGYAAWLTENALAARDVSAAQQAANLGVGDPRAQVVAGTLLEATDNRTAAIQHYQKAVALRPDDYVLHMQLARAQELEGDSNVAINSASIAVGLAPAYAQPHWQLGNMFIRAGKNDRGFAELRQACASDPKLLPATIDLAAQLSNGNSKEVILAIEPKTPEAWRALANYYARKGSSDEAIWFLMNGGEPLREDRRRYLAELINAKKFDGAQLLWYTDHPDREPLTNGGFESEIDLNEPGFGWRSENAAKSFSLSLDSVNPKAGRSSLRIDFAGPTIGVDLLSRLAPLEASAHYKLTFSFRTDQLVSGGLPYLVVIDATTDKPLAQSEIFPPATDGWREATVEFTTAENSTVRLALQRQTCPAPQCPIFGKLWLDDFFLRSMRSK